MTTLAPGIVVSDRYRLVQLLGEGGMGAVWEAEHLQMRRPVALKVLKGALTDRPDIVRRFEREMQASCRVEHPHTIRVYDYGRTADNAPWLVMEMVRGQDLEQLIEAGGAVPPARAVGIARQIARALGAIHDAGIIHRDLKLANVMVVDSDDGTDLVKVLDFGIARFTDEAAARITQTGSVIGSPQYMSPEHAQGRTTDARSDLYSLGTLLYGLLTGTLPFTGDSVLNILFQQVMADPPAPSERMTAPCPPRLERLVLDLLAKDPAARPQSARDVVARLDTCLQTGDAPTVERTARFVSPAPPPAHNIPRSPTEFVGRASELDDLAARLRSGSRLVSLIGAGGMGKTRLAAEAGRRSQAHFPAGVAFADLTEASSLDGLCSAVARSLGVTIDGDDPASHIGQALAARDGLLLIVDNFEQVVGHAHGTVARWLAASENLTILATSREALHLAGEVTVALDPLSLPTDASQDLEALAACDAVKLFVRRAQDAAPDFALSEANAADVAHIVEQLDGLPLAIELAAARARVLAPHQLRARLGKRFRLLTSRHTQRTPRQATLRGAIDWSWDLLVDWERAAMAQCAVFHGGFTLEAAEAVLDLSAWPDAPWPMDAVEALVDKSILQMRGTGGDVRFRMLESIREYAWEKLTTPTALSGAAEPFTPADIARRHASWYARYGAPDSLAVLPTLRGPALVERLVADLDNIVTAHGRAIVDRDWERAGLLALAASATLELNGPLRAAVELLDETLSHEGLPRKVRLSALVAQTEVLRKAGLWSRARRVAREAVPLARALGDGAAEGRALLEHANARACEGHIEESLRIYDAALLASNVAGDMETAAATHLGIGALHGEQGHHLEAREHFDKAWKLGEAAGSLRAQAPAMGNLAVLDRAAGDLDSARRLWGRALDVARTMRDKRIEGVLCSNLAELYSDLGQPAAAIEHVERSLRLLREVGAPRYLAIVHADAGRIRQSLGDLEGAAADFQSALTVASSIGDPRGEGVALGRLAGLALQQGNTELARGYVVRGLKVLEGTDERAEAGVLLCRLAEVELAAGDPSAARTTLDRARVLNSTQEIEATSELAQALKALSDALSGGEST